MTMADTVHIHYVQGDATRPATSGPVIIAHVCNDAGGWGAGFVLAISKRWKSPESQYRLWSKNKLPGAPPFALGEVLFVPVDHNTVIANMIGQHGIRRPSTADLTTPPPIRYDAVDCALAQVGEEALRLGASVHMPRIGCGLAGGTWDRIEPPLQTRLCGRGIAVTVYDFPSS